jgi:hypothetical protein
MCSEAATSEAGDTFAITNITNHKKSDNSDVIRNSNAAKSSSTTTTTSTCFPTQNYPQHDKQQQKQQQEATFSSLSTALLEPFVLDSNNNKSPIDNNNNDDDLTMRHAVNNKRRVDEMNNIVKVRDIGVRGLRISDFEDVGDDSGSVASAGSATMDVASPAGGNYFCIGGAGAGVSSTSTPCLTRELNQLPMPSREQVGQDLYGISSEGDIPITTELLQRLENEIQKLDDSSNSRHAYDRACGLSTEYVHNVTFRTMFLRATEGDCKKAAKRLVRHFSTKNRLFGENKLVKDITLDDLDEYDMEALESGGFQVLAEKDLAGRSVLYGRYTSMRYRTIDNMLRALWYIWMSILEDPVNQIKGVVAVGYEVGRLPLDRFDGLGEGDVGFEMYNADGGFDRDLARQIVSVPLSVPARPVGYHLCTDSHQWVGILNMVMVTLCKFIRLRMRIHHGSDQECKYALMTHGLPTGCIPVDSEGNVDLTMHMDWIENRRHIDAMKA